MAKKLSPRDKILQERGLTITQPAPRKSRKLVPRVVPNLTLSKTALMKYLESKYGTPIETILLSGSLSIVARKLGNEVDETTLSKWIKRFKLRYTKDNLPNCNGCRREGPACQSGICYVLMGLELYDLVPIMKGHLMND